MIPSDSLPMSTAGLTCRELDGFAEWTQGWAVIIIRGLNGLIDLVSVAEAAGNVDQTQSQWDR